MKQVINSQSRRSFLKQSGALASLTSIPSTVWSNIKQQKTRTAHIGVGGMGFADLQAIANHSSVEVAALCDVDSKNLAHANKSFTSAKGFADYRRLFDKMIGEIDAVIVSTPDHTHAPASLMAMEMGLPVYCQKPLTHHVSEAREMARLAYEKNLVTQMGIQVHSFYDYQLATKLIQSGIIGKVHTVHAWSPKNWGYDGPAPTSSGKAPDHLDWNLWLGTAPQRAFSNSLYHPMNWRKIMDYGCGTLGDMGVHIFDTPYNALALDVPKTITNTCRPPTGFGFPEKNKVIYTFRGTAYTAEELTWIWYDGEGAPELSKELKLPNGEKLPDQGAMFLGEKGNLLLPHFMQLPRLIVEGTYESLEAEISKYNDELGGPTKDYDTESNKHYHQFIDHVRQEGQVSAPFSYASRLTETILLGVIAGRFPNQTLHWDRKKAAFSQSEANRFLSGDYRNF
jgi:predicted dehydrogenase